MSRKTFSDQGKSILLLVAGMMLLGSALAPGSYCQAGDCYSVQIGNAVRMPDGTVYDADVITLCDTRALTPVSHLHTTYVDGEPVGMLMSVRRTTEGTGGNGPSMVFLRNVDGALDLIGYAVPGSGGRDVSFTLSRNIKVGQRLARTKKSLIHKRKDLLASAQTTSVSESAGSAPLLVLQATAN
jgi:hypothetical protein